MEKIDAIGKVTLDSKAKIEAARNAYNALTDDQKDYVSNYQTLLDAEIDYAALVAEKNEADAKAAKAAAAAAQSAADAAKKAADEAVAAVKGSDNAEAQAQAAAAEEAAAAAKEAAAKAAEAAKKLDVAAAEAAAAQAEAAQAEAEAAMAEIVELLHLDCPSGIYTDVDNLWYHPYVDYMVENGYMNGMTATEFGVDGSVTRGQLVTILYRIVGQPPVEGKSHPFTDVAEGRFYTNAVIWAVNEGIVKGMTETTFEPDTPISRQQIVTILYRYDEAEKVAQDHLAGYSDAGEVYPFAKDAMNWAIANGIVNGMTATTLAPAATATRAQICAIMMRYLEK